MRVEHLEIKTANIKLDQFLKHAGIAAVGSEAKKLIAAGEILVNEEREFRRGRKLIPGDRVVIQGQEFLVTDEGSGS